MSFRYIIADDSGFVRELLMAILEPMGGVCVGEATDGKEAESLIERTIPDLAIIDLVMPKKNGLQVISTLRLHYPEVKWLVCTSIDEVGIQQNVIREEAWIVRKPFEKSDIESAVRIVLGQREVAHG